mgnify:CR=1 FL=1
MQLAVLVPELAEAREGSRPDEDEVLNSSGRAGVDGRQVDLRPRQFIVTDRLEESVADSQTRLAECHQAVVNAEAALLKARAQLGLDPLFTKTQTPKPTRRPGTH